MIDWNKRFIDLAAHVATWSKDPSTQVGAVIVDERRQVIGMGYNGLPRGVTDSAERLHNRDVKMAMVVHAEPNAILSCTGDMRGSTIYTWPFMSCDRCAGLIIQAGIKRIIAPLGDEERMERWWPSFHTAAVMYAEAGVVAQLVTPTGNLYSFLNTMTQIKKRNTLVASSPPAPEHHCV